MVEVFTGICCGKDHFVRILLHFSITRAPTFVFEEVPVAVVNSLNLRRTAAGLVQK